MNFLQRQTTWSNAELAIFKIAVFFAGIILGIYARSFLIFYINWFWIITCVTAVVAGYLWIVKLKKQI